MMSERGIIMALTTILRWVQHYTGSSWNRNVNGAKAFLRKAMKGQRIPTKITLDA